MPSRKNIADALSRLTKTAPVEQSKDDDEYIRAIATDDVSKVLKIKEVEHISAEDPELQAVKKCIVKGNGTLLQSSICKYTMS